MSGAALHPALARPLPGEAAPAYDAYLAACPVGDLRHLLAEQATAFRRELAGLDEAAGAHRYAPGKWSLAQLVGHLADTEQILLGRALRLARGDSRPQPGFDEDAYAAAWTPSLARERERWLEQRGQTCRFFTNLAPEDWLRPGLVEDRPVSVRALGWIIAGHLEHHLRSLRQRYRPGLDPTPGEPGAPGEPRPAADACRVWRAGEAEQVLDREGIQGWRLVREQDRRLIRLHLAAGSALAPHPVPDRALFWLAAGRGRLTVEGRTVELAGGDAALVAAGATRGWEAMTDLDLLVVRGWPED